ncbi:MAG: hypothetical protein KBD63_05050 [Bacteriovoracaceae bacterium]|nr:hypothetical protein [Bacteriovoracaceae bacterium]
MVLNIKLFLLFLLQIIFFSSDCWSQEKKDHKWFRIDLAGLATSQRVFRGAVFYPYPTAFVGPSITLFEHLSIRGPNIAWTQGSRFDSHQWELGIRFITDGAPFIEFSNKFNEDTDYRASRSDAFEVYSRYNYRFGFRKLFEVGFELAKETHRHKGVYMDLNFKVPVYKYLSLNFTTGLGTKNHNRYIYGFNGKSGLTHEEITLTYALPKLPWSGLIILDASQNWVIQKTNREANLVRGNADQFIVGLKLFWFL